MAVNVDRLDHGRRLSILREWWVKRDPIPLS